ncbi:RNA polymerase sigma factor [Candidatus Soleaferrea massiliensis]|uniref:RNA polymerase sigma factor n=1 Tax=Candidatus Soleaferrea massiliensis TaxID=1470354 RepID=UPI00058FED95|nr:sigma-70 family RNA polymerase sigma factor [Candidatus Soleaferrea massiliensis]
MADQDITNLFNEIYDATRQKTLGMITAKCGSIAGIPDIFQETYMELFAILSRRGPGYIKNPEAFVMRLARQKIYRHYTLLNKIKSIVSISGMRGEDGEIHVEDLDIDTFSIEDHMSEKDLIDQILQFLSHKPLDTQKIFYLFYYLDLSIPKISKLLSISESNVKHKLYRTLQEMRKQYSEKDGEKE